MHGHGRGPKVAVGEEWRIRRLETLGGGIDGRDGDLAPGRFSMDTRLWTAAAN
jgi:hypothetical protein